MDRRYPGPIKGWAQRDRARQRNRAGWRRNRHRHWAKETEAHRPVRFLVHGDLFRQNRLDREFLADVLRTARNIPGFRGWAYTHGWKRIPPALRRHLERAGIILWASCHSPDEAQDAGSLGFPVAIVSPSRVKGYQGPKAIPDSGAGRPAIVCPHQLGKAKDCLSCRFCWDRNREGKPDVVFLSH